MPFKRHILGIKNEYLFSVEKREEDEGKKCHVENMMSKTSRQNFEINKTRRGKNEGRG